MQACGTEDILPQPLTSLQQNVLVSLLQIYVKQATLNAMIYAAHHDEDVGQVVMFTAMKVAAMSDEGKETGRLLFKVVEEESLGTPEDVASSRVASEAVMTMPEAQNATREMTGPVTPAMLAGAAVKPMKEFMESLDDDESGSDGEDPAHDILSAALARRGTPCECSICQSMDSADRDFEEWVPSTRHEIMVKHYFSSKERSLRE